MIKKAVVMTAVAGGLVLGGAGLASAHSEAEGQAMAQAHGSPGVIAGNVTQVPVAIPVNVCGNSINVIGFLNPAFGNTCKNEVE